MEPRSVGFEKPYRLYFSLRSPFARRVRLALLRLGIEFDPMIVNVFEPTPELIRANPLGQIPILEQLTSEQYPRHLIDSSLILEFLHEQNGQRIWPAATADRAAVRNSSALAVGIMTATVMYYLESLKTVPDTDTLLEHQETVTHTLDHIHAQNLSQRPWVEQDEGAEKLTQAGWDLAVAWNYLEVRITVADINTKYPKLKDFFNSHRSHPLLARTVPPPA